MYQNAIDLFTNINFDQTLRLVKLKDTVLKTTEPGTNHKWILVYLVSYIIVLHGFLSSPYQLNGLKSYCTLELVKVVKSAENRGSCVGLGLYDNLDHH